MGIIKPKLKKKKVPYKRIGLAIVPPAAFTVVPGYTLPRTNGMPKTKGVKRFAASSTAIVASIALPNVVNELDDDEEDSWSFNSLPNEDGDKHNKKTNITKVITPSAAIEQINKDKSRRKKSSRRETEHSDRRKSPRSKQSEQQPIREEVLKPSKREETKSQKPSKREETKSQKPSQSKQKVDVKPTHRSPRQREQDSMDDELNENAATVLMKTTMEHDIEDEINENFIELMQNIIDKNSIKSDSSIISGIDPDDGTMEKQRRKKRQKIRKLKNLLETKSISSLEGDDDASSDVTRLKRRKSLKKLKDRVTRSSVTSLEQEFGNQLTFGRKKKRNDRSNKYVDVNTSRYDIIEESLQRALTELHYFQQEFGKQSHIRKQAEIITFENHLPHWMTDPDKLSPLFASYDRKLKRKDEEIKILQENLSLIGSGDFSGKKSNVENLEESLNNLREENCRLLSKCHEFSLQVSSLQDHIEREGKKNQEIDRMYKQVKQELQIALEDLSISEKEKEKMKIEGREKRSIISNLEEEITTSVPKTIHNVEIKGLKMEMEKVQERHEYEINNYKTMLKTSQNEQGNLQLETSTLSAHLTAAQNHIESLLQEKSKNDGEIEKLQEEKLILINENKTSKLHLSNIIQIVEQLQQTTFDQLIQQENSNQIINQSKQDKYQIGKMEQMLHQVKIRLSTQTDELNEKLENYEKSHENEVKNLKREIHHLNQEVENKNILINKLLLQQRRTEVEMDAIYKNATNETQFIMNDFLSN